MTDDRQQVIRAFNSSQLKKAEHKTITLINRCLPFPSSVLFVFPELSIMGNMFMPYNHDKLKGLLNYD